MKIVKSEKDIAIPQADTLKDQEVTNDREEMYRTVT